MPWFPEFASAAELAREETRAAGHADPVREYLTALNDGDARVLEKAWPGDVVIYDPRAGEVRGHRHVREFIKRNLSWQADLHARTERVASTVAGGRAVVELLAYMDHGGRPLAWPVAVVAEFTDDVSVVFRTYCSQWPLDEKRPVRPPVLPSDHAGVPGVVGRYLAAVAAGDTEEVVAAFAPDGYFCGPFGPRYAHRGTDELRSFFARCFSEGGGIGLEPCAVTDDGVRCALEYNCVRWGDRELPPQAGIGVYERGEDGLLAAVRVYDDIQAPRLVTS
jgi:ketosteroid isomerase-like protein